MIKTFGLDTNVLVRFLLNDDPNQSILARRLFENASQKKYYLTINQLVLQETEWVLRTYSKIDKEEMINIFFGLLNSQNLMIEEEKSVEQALIYYKNSSADFSDCLLLARYELMNCTLLTFDKKASKL